MKCFNRHVDCRHMTWFQSPCSFSVFPLYGLFLVKHTGELSAVHSSIVDRHLHYVRSVSFFFFILSVQSEVVFWNLFLSRKRMCLCAFAFKFSQVEFESDFMPQNRGWKNSTTTLFSSEKAKEHDRKVDIIARNLSRIFIGIRQPENFMLHVLRARGSITNKHNPNECNDSIFWEKQKTNQKLMLTHSVCTKAEPKTRATARAREKSMKTKKIYFEEGAREMN